MIADENNGLDVTDKEYPPFPREFCSSIHLRLIQDETVASCVAVLREQQRKGVDITRKSVFPPFCAHHVQQAKELLFGAEGTMTMTHNVAASRVVGYSSTTVSDSSRSTLTHTTDSTSTQHDFQDDQHDSFDDLSLGVPFSDISLSGLLRQNWMDEIMDDDDTDCKCEFFGGSCIDDDCVNYRAGRECSLATCTNPACKNRCIQDNSFPDHTIFTTNETSDEIYMIADCEIDKGQRIAPVYGNAVSLQSI